MRAALEALERVTIRATALEGSVAQVVDRERRVELMVALTRSHSAIREAVARFHAFDVDGVTDRIAAVARELNDVAAAVRPLP